MRRRRTGTAGDQHRAWLELLDTDGPFLSIPTLTRVWPQGMPPSDRTALARLADASAAFESAWVAWDSDRDSDTAVTGYRSVRDAWVDLVLTKVIGWSGHYTTDPDQVARWAQSVNSPDHTVTITATGVVQHDDEAGALVWVIDPVGSLREPPSDGWAASLIDRMEELLRRSGVPLGIVTDGRWWGVVSARPHIMVASGITDALTWTEEPQTRDAFFELLRLQRLLGGKPGDRLTELFAESVAAAEEITLALGVQVRRAVELLVRALSEVGLDAQRRGRPSPLPDPPILYDAAVTMLMRVVFLLFAEERGLLPQASLFAAGYGLTDRIDLLDTRAREESAEALDATHLTWHHLLATSSALHRGATFEDLRLPAYGGSLFDPDRYPFLLARSDRGTLAITITDRVMLEVLRAVQIARLPGQPPRRISFRDIDVEQIGYIYEGLLGYSCASVDEVTVGLHGKQGEEPEITLVELEALAVEHPGAKRFAAALIETVKASQPSCKPASAAKLAKAYTEDVEDAERALRATTVDEALRDRLRPFLGIIRRDLRGRPFVVPAGGMIVVETPSRQTAGAHYTPRSLAEDVVRYALEPLVYRPGPHQTADQGAWWPISSDEITALKVADIACGSGAFLVAAARYLADRLVEAWRREGVATGTGHDQRVRALRTIVATCLYGADINPMAVEMCKLSLWLVSLDPRLPFSFVDDKILCGNSLLGLTDRRQLESLNINPDNLPEQPLFDVGKDNWAVGPLDVDAVLRQAARLRRSLATEVNEDDPQRSTATKRRQWLTCHDLTAQLTDVADGVVAAGLRHGGKTGRALDEAYEDLRVAVSQAYPSGDKTPDRAMLHGILDAGLTPTVDTDYARWQPLHWILAVPDVMENGGFDAIVGNPPFLGGKKISGALGVNMRAWLVNMLAGGRRGNADLVAYFFLRAVTLLSPRGALGLIATNTIAQGETRVVGLDQMVDGAFTITRSVQSRKWPAESANLEYAAVWGARGRVADGVAYYADELRVGGISTLLEPMGAVFGTPARLLENGGTAFNGCYVLGVGYVLDPDEALDWIAVDPRNSEVLFPYLNGEDLNSRPDCSASRWVIDFNDRIEKQASLYELPYQRVVERVKPQRRKVNRKVHRDRWWQYADKRPAMRKAIAVHQEVLVIAQVSKTLMPGRVPTHQVLDAKLVVFATHKYHDQAVLSSSVHQVWVIKYGTTMRTDPTYTPTAVFETFPRPTCTDELEMVGKTLDTDRREIMLRRQLGLTSLYNLVNDPDLPDTADQDVARLRQIHIELDHVVMDAYGWGDVPLDHGFHTYRQMTRWTVSPAARVEMLDRLLEENHRRAALEAQVGKGNR